MAVSDEDIAFVYDLFSDIPGLTHRKMMGGLSLYSEGQVFAILSSEGVVYVKAECELAVSLADEGCRIFEMTRKDGRVASMGYWTLPESALDDPETACDWGRRAIAAQV